MKEKVEAETFEKLPLGNKCYIDMIIDNILAVVTASKKDTYIMYEAATNIVSKTPHDVKRESELKGAVSAMDVIFDAINRMAFREDYTSLDRKNILMAIGEKESLPEQDDQVN